MLVAESTVESGAVSEKMHPAAFLYQTSSKTGGIVRFSPHCWQAGFFGLVPDSE